MQKSAQPAKMAQRPLPRPLDASSDKGQKYEPFFNAAGFGELRSLARLQKSDQKR